MTDRIEAALLDAVRHAMAMREHEVALSLAMILENMASGREGASRALQHAPGRSGSARTTAALQPWSRDYPLGQNRC